MKEILNRLDLAIKNLILEYLGGIESRGDEKGADEEIKLLEKIYGKQEDK